MSISKKTYKYIFIIIIFFLTLNGCGSFFNLFSSPAPLEQKPLNELIQEGMNAFKNTNFDKALDIFQYIKDTYPFTPEALVAQLKLADAFYYTHDYGSALLSYEEFVKLHPRHKETPYALYQIGMCYFHQTLSIDRDQSITQDALEAFKRAIKEYPNSYYAKRALAKFKICREKLAEYEFYVARFYYRTHNYKPAFLRFWHVVKNYPDLSISCMAQKYLDLCKAKLESKASLTTSIF